MKAVVRKIRVGTHVDEFMHRDAYTDLMRAQVGRTIEVAPMEYSSGWYVQAPHGNWVYETYWHSSWLIFEPVNNDLLTIAQEMYSEVATRMCEQERVSQKEMGNDDKDLLVKWFGVIKHYDPAWLVDLDELVPEENR